MPLESTTNIAGLNPAWPTGTDPKSQGDDHLRLIKTVLDTTWPNSNGTKIEQTVPLRLPNGSAAAPAASFTADSNIGMYRIAANELGFAAVGQEILSLSGAGTKSSRPFLGPDGTATDPSFSFANDLNTGMNSGGNGIIDFVCNSSKQFEIAVGGVAATGTVWAGFGTEALPAYAFTSDPDCGLMGYSGNAIGLSTNGVNRLFIDTASIIATLPVQILQGTAAAPGIFFAVSNNTGLFRLASNQIGFSLGGVERARLSNANDSALSLQTRAFADARYAPISDARLKTEVQSMGSPWDSLGWLRPVTYRWTFTDDWGRPEGVCTGLIAQEVAEVLPNAVRDNGEVLSLDLLPLVALLIKAVQDLKRRVELLET